MINKLPKNKGNIGLLMLAILAIGSLLYSYNPEISKNVGGGSGTIRPLSTGSASPLTTKGDLYTYSTGNARLPVGTNGFVLSADSAETTGLKWISAPSGITLQTNGIANGSQTLFNAQSTLPLGITDDGFGNILWSIATANGATTGAISSTDWNTFNNKVSSQWVTSGSDIYYDTGKVQVGSSTVGASKFNVFSTTGAIQRLETNTSTLDLDMVTTAGQGAIGINSDAVYMQALDSLSKGLVFWSNTGGVNELNYLPTGALKQTYNSSNYLTTSISSIGSVDYTITSSSGTPKFNFSRDIYGDVGLYLDTGNIGLIPTGTGGGSSLTIQTTANNRTIEWDTKIGGSQAIRAGIYTTGFGIGTTAPVGALNVESLTQQLRLAYSSSVGLDITMDSVGNINWNTIGGTNAINYFNQAIVSPKFIVASTSSPVTLNSATDIDNKVHTNEGASAQIVYNLPSASTGEPYTFVVQDTDGIKIQANTGDTINIAGVVSSAGGYAESFTIGAVVTLVSINATEWVALSSLSTWTVI